MVQQQYPQQSIPGAVQEPEYFKLKKYTLLVLIGLGIVVCVALFFFAPEVANTILLRFRDDSEESRDKLMTAIRLLAAVFAVFSFVMFYGIKEHHICLVTAFTVLQGINAIISVLGFLAGATDLSNVAGPLIVAVIAYLFLRDIRLMKEQERAAKVQRGAVAA